MNTHFAKHMTDASLFNALNDREPRRALGLLIEFSPLNQFLNLESLNLGFKYFLKADLKHLDLVSPEKAAETLVLIQDDWEKAKPLLTSPVLFSFFRLGFRIDRSCPLNRLDFRLPRTKVFFHFPIDEIDKAHYWNLDEIFLYLTRDPEALPGPDVYDVFEPRWKYHTDELAFTKESEFHSRLDKNLYAAAAKETRKDRVLRKALRTEAYIKARLSVINKSISYLYHLWLRHIFWPLEYRLFTLIRPMPTKEFERMKYRRIRRRRFLRKAFLRKLRLKPL